MTTPIELLDIVALTADRLDKGLLRERVGTVVETLAPGVYEVEFSMTRGTRTRSLPCVKISFWCSAMGPSSPLDCPVHAEAPLWRTRSLWSVEVVAQTKVKNPAASQSLIFNSQTAPARNLDVRSRVSARRDGSGPSRGE